jgi:hypothetical protein
MPVACARRNECARVSVELDIGRWALSIGRNVLKKRSSVVEGRKLSVSNLNKVLYPKVGFTKGQVIDYYIPDRAGASAASARPAANDEALPKRSRCRILLRKELSIPSTEVGEDGEGLE